MTASQIANQKSGEIMLYRCKAWNAFTAAAAADKCMASCTAGSVYATAAVTIAADDTCDTNHMGASIKNPDRGGAIIQSPDRYRIHARICRFLIPPQFKGNESDMQPQLSVLADTAGSLAAGCTIAVMAVEYENSDRNYYNACICKFLVCLIFKGGSEMQAQRSSAAAANKTQMQLSFLAIGHPTAGDDAQLCSGTVCPSNSANECDSNHVAVNLKYSLNYMTGIVYATAAATIATHNPPRHLGGKNDAPLSGCAAAPAGCTDAAHGVADAACPSEADVAYSLVADAALSLLADMAQNCSMVADAAYPSATDVVHSLATDAALSLLADMAQNFMVAVAAHHSAADVAHSLAAGTQADDNSMVSEGQCSPDLHLIPAPVVVGNNSVVNQNGNSYNGSGNCFLSRMGSSAPELSNYMVCVGPCAPDLSSAAVKDSNSNMVSVGSCGPDLLLAPNLVGRNLVGTQAGDDSMVGLAPGALDLSSAAASSKSTASLITVPAVYFKGWSAEGKNSPTSFTSNIMGVPCNASKSENPAKKKMIANLQHPTSSCHIHAHADSCTIYFKPSSPALAADAAFPMADALSADGAYSMASHSIAADAAQSIVQSIQDNCIPSMPSAYKLMSDFFCSPSEGENFSMVADAARCMITDSSCSPSEENAAANISASADVRSDRPGRAAPQARRAHRVVPAKIQAGPRSPKPRCPWRGRGSVYTTNSSAFVSISSFMESALSATALSFFTSTRSAFSLIQNVLRQTASSRLRSGSSHTKCMSM